jgi:hypothetical protein
MNLIGLVQVACATATGDKSPLCQKWAETGECDSNPSYMTVNCAASCSKILQSVNLKMEDKSPFCQTC